MNANEVIATLASRALAVRYTRTTTSTRRSRPTTCSVRDPLAAVRLFARDLIPALKHLASVLTVKAEEFAGVVRSADAPDGRGSR